MIGGRRGPPLYMFLVPSNITSNGWRHWRCRWRRPRLLASFLVPAGAPLHPPNGACSSLPLGVPESVEQIVSSVFQLANRMSCCALLSLQRTLRVPVFQRSRGIIKKKAGTFSSGTPRGTVRSPPSFSSLLLYSSLSERLLSSFFQSNS